MVMSDKTVYDGAVFYTDGSARPNPGAFGCGVHGYAYCYPNEKQKATKVEAYFATDMGYILQKDLAASKAKEVHVLKYMDGFRSSLEEGTNNIGEIGAAIMALKDFREITEGLPRIYIAGDSEYVVMGATEWIPNWIRNGWKSSTGAPVKNQREWILFHDAICAFKEHGVFNIGWVRGHNDELGNVKADYLAGIATNHSQDGVQRFHKVISEPQGYHKYTVDFDPLFSLKRLYFNTDKELNVPGLYYQTGYSTNDYVAGKRTSDASFSVVRLSEPNPALEAIIEAQCTRSTQQNTVVFAKLERVRSVDLYPYLKEFGRYATINDPRNLSINFLDFKPITQAVREGELPLRTIDVLSHLEEILVDFEEHYLKTQEMQSVLHKIHDVTGTFYDFSEKKRGQTIVPIMTLKKTFGVGAKSTKVEVMENTLEGEKLITLPLLFTDDMPTRNAFKSIETLEPSVYVVTWRDAPTVIRYATLVKTNQAVSIWCNYFANQVLL
jgi:ribonuclease HI